MERNIGARGLRAVMEGLLTKVMYDVPSDPTITDVIITDKDVRGRRRPSLRLLHDPEKGELQRGQISKTAHSGQAAAAPAS